MDYNHWAVTGNFIFFVIHQGIRKNATSWCSVMLFLLPMLKNFSSAAAFHALCCATAMVSVWVVLLLFVHVIIHVVLEDLQQWHHTCPTPEIIIISVRTARGGNTPSADIWFPRTDVWSLYAFQMCRLRGGRVCACVRVCVVGGGG